VQVYKHITPDHGYLTAVVPFYVIGIVLLALAPGKPAMAN
jgi:hypothetical protein